MLFLAATFLDHLPVKLRNVNLFRNPLRKILVEREYYDVKTFLANKFTDADVLKFESRTDLDKYSK
jgi:hypothetical protein